MAAIRAAQLGAEVTLIEKEALGGTCLNVGCIPTKTFLECAHIYHKAGASQDMGIYAEPILNWEQVQKYKNEVVNKLVSGVSSLMRMNGIKVMNGTASFLDSHTAAVRDKEGNVNELSSDYFILASGSQPFVPEIPGIEQECCIDSTKALALSKIPESLVVMGGGVIGVELATAFHEFGTRVTIVEMMPHILPNMDFEMSERLKRDMQRKGIDIRTETKVVSIEKGTANAICRIESKGQEDRIEAEKVLVCIGRRPFLKDLELDKAGVKTGKAIETDEYLRTSQKHIYAVGDCNGKLMLAHAASDQGVLAAEHCMGLPVKFEMKACPNCVYSDPELASAGLSEQEARNKGIPYKVGRFPMAANGRALIMGGNTGLVKVLTGEQYGEILGVHIYGPQAAELIAEGTLAIQLEATADELIETIHAHPTISECIHEAALSVEGRAIHIADRKG